MNRRKFLKILGLGSATIPTLGLAGMPDDPEGVLPLSDDKDPVPLNPEIIDKDSAFEVAQLDTYQSIKNPDIKFLRFRGRLGLENNYHCYRAGFSMSKQDTTGKEIGKALRVLSDQILATERMFSTHTR